jgi:cell division protein FtsA
MKINKKITAQDVVVAIDVGTTKICVLIAQKITDDQCEIIGIGKAPSVGLDKGVIVDVSPAIESIKAALYEAELMAGHKVESAYIGISGAHIKAHNSTGMVPVKHGDIRQTDIERVIAAAKAIPLPEGEQILHVMPQIFTIDGTQTVRDPLGMHGVRLEARVHIITGSVTSVQNLIRCCEATGIKVQDIVLEPIASAESVLSIDERELGVGMLDIGGGTSDFAIYQKGSIRHTRILPIAGNLFTNDIALCMRTTRAEADRVKKEYGVIKAQSQYTEQYCELLTIDGENKQAITIHELSQIITPRAQELLLLVHHEIQKYHLAQFMPAGLVITGGGSQLIGLINLAEVIINQPARLGRPRVPINFKKELDNPIYATGYGLLLYATKKEKRDHLAQISGPLVSRVFWKMKSWIADFF